MVGFGTSSIGYTWRWLKAATVYVSPHRCVYTTLEWSTAPDICCSQHVVSRHHECIRSIKLGYSSWTHKTAMTHQLCMLWMWSMASSAIWSALCMLLSKVNFVFFFLSRARNLPPWKTQPWVHRSTEWSCQTSTTSVRPLCTKQTDGQTDQPSDSNRMRRNTGYMAYQYWSVSICSCRRHYPNLQSRFQITGLQPLVVRV